MERRTLQTYRPQLVRSTDGKPSKIAGYAAVYYNASDPGTEYELYRGNTFRLVERFLPGCFDRAVREDDVRALFNHNADNILGRLRSGTLRLFSDAKGLRYEIDPPDTTLARDLIESLKRGDVTGSSFCFDYVTTTTTEERRDGIDQEILQVSEAKLFDVGPVTFPAYTSTTSEARAQARKTSGGFRWTPALMRSHIEKLESDLADFDKRLAANSPRLSKRNRRDRIRDRCNRVVAKIERDGIALLEQEVADARRLVEAGRARRK